MDLDHWKQLDSLLQSVLERPLEERDAFLQHACAGDEPLERRVRALLSAEPDAKHFLGRPAIEVAALALADAQHDDAGHDQLGGVGVDLGEDPAQLQPDEHEHHALEHELQRVPHGPLDQAGRRILVAG